MQYILMVLFGAGIVAADQLTKLWVVDKIPLFTEIPALPHIFHLTYVQNTGAAFSMLAGQQWLFAILFVLLMVMLVWEFIKKPVGLGAFERWCAVAIYAGGLGNMIDRLRLGYVVDMIELEFMNFAVFNVADCFITCGSIALMVSLTFFNKSLWKDGKK